MLKPTSIKALLVALAVIFSSLMPFSKTFTTPASATADKYDITNVGEFCEYFKVEGYGGTTIWPSDDCTSLAGWENSITFDRMLYVRGSDIVTIYFLELTYTGPRTPLNIQSDGKLILKNVKMTSRDCLFVGDYDLTRKVFGPAGVEIHSGIFTATGGEVGSPFCARYTASDEPFDAKGALENFLAENSYYASVTTGKELVLEDGKDLGLSVHNFSKDFNEKEPTYYIRGRTVLVLEGEGRGEVEEPEPEPEPETPETPENPEPSEKPEVVIPKAPNTGSSK